VSPCGLGVTLLPGDPANLDFSVSLPTLKANKKTQASLESLSM